MEGVKNTILESLNEKYKDFALIILAACRNVPCCWCSPQAEGNHTLDSEE